MYDFENKDKIPFNELAGDQMKMVVDGLKSELTQRYWGDCWAVDDDPFSNCIGVFNSVYQVLSTPYTLEDALTDVAKSKCANDFGDDYVISCNDAMNIIRKFAASLEASK